MVAAEPQVRVLKAEGSGALTSVAFSSDGRWLAQTEYALIRVWDLKAGKVLRSWKPPDEGVGELHSVTFSPDGKRLAVRGRRLQLRDLGLRLRERQTALAEADEEGVGSSTLLHARWEMVGEHGRLLSRRKQNILTVWSATDGELQRELEGTLNNNVYREVPIAFAPDGKTVAAVSDHGKVILWNIESGRPIRKSQWLSPTIPFLPSPSRPTERCWRSAR